MKNKKLFAILTLVCFMFTLMPVAAFAAPADELSPTASVFATAKTGVEVLKNENAVAQISLKNAGDNAYVGNVTSVVYVWAEATANQPSDALVVAQNTEDPTTASIAAGKIALVGNGVYSINMDGVTGNVADFAISFLRAGSFTLKASFENPLGLSANEVRNLVVFGGAADAYKTVKVTSAAPDTEYWGVLVNDDAEVLHDGDERVATVDVNANGVKTETVTLTVYGGNETYPAAKATSSTVSGYPVALDTNSSNIELSDTNLMTNHNGQVEFKVAGMREGTYKVYVTVGDLECTILVKVGATSANDIEVIKAPTAPVAKDTKTDDYKDLVRFQITDVNGNVFTGDAGYCDDSTVTNTSAPYVTFVEKPAASKLTDKNLYIKRVGTEDYYTVALTSGNFDVEGTYTVKAILNNGNSATVTWEVKKFVSPVELKLVYKQEAVELNGTAELDKLVYVDANGVEKVAKDAELAATGYAISVFYPEAADIYTNIWDTTEKNYVSTKVGEAKKGDVVVSADEKYVGSEITVTAVAERYNLIATATIKVTSDAAELKFADKTAEVNVNNKIDVQLVDAEGSKVAPTNVDKTEIYYVILDKPADAKVTATTASDSDFADKGVFTMALTSNKVGNVAVQAVAKLTTNAGVVKYYTGTQIFAVGTESAGDVVVMSIGSNSIIVNDEVAAIDAAPVVENGRTFVPFRALAEAFGANVAYDEATQAVTAELNGVTVVMTIGSAEYTVNGEAKTMDVAPYIVDGRTMVPVRFAAEAFGIKVIPTYDENGATADILFNL